MVNLMFIPMALFIPAIVAVEGENLTNTQCEDGWSDETSVGLGCLLFEMKTREFNDSKMFCKNQESALIELVTELQLKHLSNLLKNVSGDATYWRWRVGAVTVKEQVWRWIESGAPVQEWAWGRLYPSNRNDTTNLVFRLFLEDNSYYGVDVPKDYFARTVCQKPPAETTTPITDTTNGEDSGESDTVPLVAGISAGVAIIVIVVAVIAYTAYWHYHDKKVWARTGGTRPPKFGPSTDYCEGYYGDDRPRRRGLNEVIDHLPVDHSNQSYF